MAIFTQILHEDLGLIKKSARWVPKLLTDAQKDERVRTCKQFTAAIRRDSMHRRYGLIPHTQE